jgi:hypothetical protein
VRARDVAAVLGVAGTATVVGACGAAPCGETLTCGDAVSSDAAPNGGGDDRTIDAWTDALIDASAADAHEGAADAPTTACERGGQSCAPAIPPAFQGPVAFVESTADGGLAPAPPNCAPPYSVDAVDGYDVPIFAPATCQCACGDVDAGCTAPAIQTFTDNVCVNSCTTVLAGTCTAAGCTSTSQSAKIVTGAQAQGGSCPESVQKVVPVWRPTQDWGAMGRGCAIATALPDGGCTGTDLCVPALPVGGALCVWQAGDTPCPATYPRKVRVYASATDSRGCTDQCSCGPPTGVTCASTTTVSPSASCTGGTLLLAGSCVSYASAATPHVSTTVTPMSGSCTPGGASAPTGTVAPAQPTTVCCAS